MTSGLLAKVQIARRQLALADEDYRAILERVTGRTSSKGLPDGALEAVLAEFRRLGWAPKAGKAGGNGYGQPHVRKIYALWKEAAIVGAIANGSKEALRHFVERQTRYGGPRGREAPEFCTPTDANKVSEALKAMIKRAEAR
jgi:phage gp16-like protein